MDPETARLIWLSLLGGGCVVWALGLRVTLRALGGSSPEMVLGRVELDLPASDVRRHLVQGLAASPMLGARVTAADDDEVRATLRTVPPRARGNLPSEPEGVDLLCRLEGGRSHTTLDWHLDVTPLGRRLPQIGAGFLAAGLVALAVAAWAMPTFVLDHPEAAVRAQAVQTLQVIHFLWPPFLLAAVRRRIRANAVRLVEDHLNNLRFTARA